MIDGDSQYNTKLVPSQHQMEQAWNVDKLYQPVIFSVEK
jgi:hypothetical protein